MSIIDCFKLFELETLKKFILKYFCNSKFGFVFAAIIGTPMLAASRIG